MRVMDYALFKVANVSTELHDILINHGFMVQASFSLAVQASPVRYPMKALKFGKTVQTYGPNVLYVKN